MIGDSKMKKRKIKKKKGEKGGKRLCVIVCVFLPFFLEVEDPYMEGLAGLIAKEVSGDNLDFMLQECPLVPHKLQGAIWAALPQFSINIEL